LLTWIEGNSTGCHACILENSPLLTWKLSGQAIVFCCFLPADDVLEQDIRMQYRLHRKLFSDAVVKLQVILSLRLHHQPAFLLVELLS